MNKDINQISNKLKEIWNNYFLDLESFLKYNFYSNIQL